VDDVTVKATVRLGDERGARDATVVGVTEYLFRGSTRQGAPFNGAYPDLGGLGYPHILANPKVGMYLYHFSVDHVHAQCETEYSVTPDVQFKQQNKAVEWAMPRKVIAKYWGPGANPVPVYVPTNGVGWADDGNGVEKKNFDSQRTNTHILRMDAPGWTDLPLTANFRFTLKALFKQHLDVFIGDKWYVLSENTEWHAIIHTSYDDAEGQKKWRLLPAPDFVNRVLEGNGGLQGSPLDWLE
jgi:hypothetical protein